MIKGIKTNFCTIDKGKNWEKNKNEMQVAIVNLYSKIYLEITILLAKHAIHFWILRVLPSYQNMYNLQFSNQHEQEKISTSKKVHIRIW